MYKYLCLISFLMLSASNSVLAQSKLEKESRIKEKDVPTKALTFIDSLNIDTKVKWYLEEGLNKKSIEAKFKRNKKKYSIEFDSLGIIEDIEVEVKWIELDNSLIDSISSQLKQNCSKFNVAKVQKQYKGTEHDLFTALKTVETNDQLEIKYEIIVRCKQQNEVNLFEYLFSEKGKLISRLKIVFRNSSHLVY